MIEVYTNAGDKLVRSVKLKTSSSELVRPVNKIVLLEEDQTYPAWQALSFMGGGLISNGQVFGGHGGGLRACRKAHLS